MEKVIEHYQIFYADTKNSKNHVYGKDVCCRVMSEWINRVGMIYQDESCKSRIYPNIEDLPIIGYFDHMEMDAGYNLFVDLHLYKKPDFRFFTPSGFGTVSREGIVDSDYEFDCIMNSEVSTIPGQVEKVLSDLEMENKILKRQNKLKDMKIRCSKAKHPSEDEDCRFVSVEPEDESFCDTKVEPEVDG